MTTPSNLLPKTTRLPRTPAEREGHAQSRARTPFGAPSTKLDVNVRALRDSGYHVHWFNDVDNRIFEAQNAAYEFVTLTEIGAERGRADVGGTDERVSKRVGVNSDGTPLMAYLMKVKQEYFEDDEESKIDQDRRVMANMTAGLTEESTKSDMQVVGGISLKTEMR